MVTPIPEGYHSVTPYMFIKGAAEAIELYKKAFGATEVMRMASPDGVVQHAELQVGDSRIMLSDENPEMNVLSPKSLGGAGMALLIYTEDVDALTKRAAAAGMTVDRAPEDQFYGDRVANVSDPYGFRWFLHTHVEDVTPEQMAERMKAAVS
jgi:PhnB protein